MRVYISADIEGVTGVVAWSQCGRPDGHHFDYAWARKMMTHDVNAAIRGARKAGATKIVVKDSHGNSKNLLISDLEPGVELISGFGSGNNGMMNGIEDGFDAAMLIGYHAMAGTTAGIMEHTITGGVHRMTINGRPAGEIGLSAGVAGMYNVPIVTVSSDRAGCLEARDLLPGVVTATVKTGLGRYMGQCLHPEQSFALIEKAAEVGVREATSIEPHRWPEPAVIRCEFNRSESADLCARLPEAKRIDGYTIEVSGETYADAHRRIWIMFALSGLGIESNN